MTGREALDNKGQPRNDILIDRSRYSRLHLKMNQGESFTVSRVGKKYRLRFAQDYGFKWVELNFATLWEVFDHLFTFTLNNLVGKKIT